MFISLSCHCAEVVSLSLQSHQEPRFLSHFSNILDVQLPNVTKKGCFTSSHHVYRRHALPVKVITDSCTHFFSHLNAQKLSHMTVATEEPTNTQYKFLLLYNRIHPPRHCWRWGWIILCCRELCEHSRRFSTSLASIQEMQKHCSIVTTKIVST